MSLRVTTALMVLFLTTLVKAQPYETGAGSSGAHGQVLVEQPEDFTQSYKQRRGRHGALFSVGVEKFYPAQYYSQFLDAGIGDIIGDTRINLVSVELGYKYNFSLGSIAILGNYAQGGTNGHVSNAERNLSFVRQGLSANYAMDALFEEPYVVPYIQGGAHQFLVTESSTTGDKSGSAGLAFNYRLGVLFQLDWIDSALDPSGKADRSSSSLENTYIDVYYAEYLASSNAMDPANPTANAEPNLASSGELGFGLKLEF